MLVIIPQEITDDSIIAYNIPKEEPGATDYDIDALYLSGDRAVYGNNIYQAVAGVALNGTLPWSADTSYAASQRAYVEATHKIYQANSDTKGQDPSNYSSGSSPVWTEVGTINRGVSLDDEDFWVQVGSTNYWGMFDPYTDTQTVGVPVDGGFLISAEINASKRNAVSLFNLAGDYVELTVLRSGSVLWSKTVPIIERSSKTYSDYFFGRNIKIRTSFFAQFPVYFSTTLKVKIFGSSVSKCGKLSPGYLKNVATTLNGVNLSIVDYSKVNTNEFGVTSISKGKTKKKQSIPMVIDTVQISDYYRFFEQQIPSTPCTFICDNDGSTECMTVHGIYQNFSVVVPGSDISNCSLDILGIN
uniref:Uncharacterized protein n=1 Tax=Desulfovibrio sp. U5L TaxID=596152 RepID=I2Q2M7_9BACT